MIAIHDISYIDGIRNNDLESIKQNLLEFCSFLLIRDEISINKLKTLNLPSDLYSSIIGNWDHYIYYHEFEKVFAQKYETKESPYQDEWRKRGAINGQRGILWQLSGGRDFLTGEKFTEIYKRENPDKLSQLKLESMTERDLEKAAMFYIKRHHFRTDIDPEIRVDDCRLSALVLVWGEYEEVLHGRIRINPKFGEVYANRFENTIKQLMQGSAPSYWEKRFYNEFKYFYRNGENTEGLKFLFYQEFF